MVARADYEAIEDENLQDIALCFITIDTELLAFVKPYLDDQGKVSPTRFKSIGPSRKYEDLFGLAKSIEQLESIKDGKFPLHKSYLRHDLLMSFWVQIGQLVQLLGEDCYVHTTKPVFIALAGSLRPLPDYMRLAARRGVLSNADREGVRSRMLQLDKLVAMYRRETYWNDDVVGW